MFNKVNLFTLKIYTKWFNYFRKRNNYRKQYQLYRVTGEKCRKFHLFLLTLCNKKLPINCPNFNAKKVISGFEFFRLRSTKLLTNFKITDCRKIWFVPPERRLIYCMKLICIAELMINSRINKCTKNSEKTKTLDFRE